MDADNKQIWVVVCGGMVVSASTDKDRAKDKAEREATKYDEASETEWRESLWDGAEELWYRRAESRRWTNTKHILQSTDLDDEK